MPSLLRLLILAGVLVVGVLGFFGSGAGAADPASGEWAAAPVPGTWDRAGEGGFADHRGDGWYRCYVRVPNRWADVDGRPLWVESVALILRDVQGAYTAYVNGVKVGSAGSASEDGFEPASSGQHRHKVPPGTLDAERLNTITVRVHHPEEAGGFPADPPVIVGYYKEILLEGSWRFRAGPREPGGSGPIEEAPDQFVYDEAVPSTTPLSAPKEFYHGERLAPEKTMARMEVDEALRLEQVLTEPRIAQPLHLSFDERGRLWVVEYRQYPYPAGLKMVSRDKYYRAVYDKELPPPPYGEDSPFRGRDRISIHEDTDGDGEYEKHKTFLDGLNITTAVARGRGGVWVLSPPQLLFYPDEDGDDVPDGEPEVHLTGFKLEDTHSVANSLTWGPDGWLYGAQGSTVTGAVKRPGTDEEPVRTIGQNIWRYHPETQEYEIFAEGGGNAFGIEFDSKGRLFSGHNGGNTRGFHYVQGGYYKKGTESKLGSLSNPYVFGALNHIKHGPAPRFTHDFVIYEGGALPEEFRRDLFAIEPKQGRLVRTEMERHGSSYQTEDVNRPVVAGDPSVRPVEITLGPEGAIYVADFYEEFIAHGQHYQGQLDPTSGRVYRLSGKSAGTGVDFDNLAERSTDELIDLLSHDNRWVRRTAQRLIGDRDAESVVPQLERMVRRNEGQLALEALWALNLSGGFDAGTAAQLTLDHTNPHVRRWSVRLLGDNERVSGEIASRLVAMAGSEASAQVRSQLASTARRLPVERGLPIIEALLKREEDVEDPHIPLLLWWGIEHHAEDARSAVLDLFRGSALWREPMVEKHILARLMRRYAEAGGQRNLLACATLLDRAPAKRHRKALMRGFEEAYQGRSLGDMPDPLVDALASGGGASLVLRVRRGDAEAVKEALEIVTDAGASEDRRLELIQAFGEVDRPKSMPALLEVASDEDAGPALRKAALNALQRYNREEIGRRVVELYSDLPGGVRSAAEALLASRVGWSRRLAEAVKAGRIEADAVPDQIVQQMEFHDDAELKKLIAAAWGETAAGADGEKSARDSVEDIKAVLDDGSGNLYRGKRVFMQACGTCHRLFNTGGQIGPDLTSYQREDVEGMIRNILRPSVEVREGYETYAVITEDGRTVTGFLTDRSDRSLTIRGLDGQDVTLPKSKVQRTQALGRSLMPPGLLNGLTDQQIRDLFAYLRTPQPVPER